MQIYPNTLSTNSVSIQSDEYGMRAYVNSTRGRAKLEAECTADIVKAVEGKWGDKPTVTELTMPTPLAPQPTATDILGQQVAALTISGAQKDTLISKLGQQMVQAQLDIAALKGGKTS